MNVDLKTRIVTEQEGNGFYVAQFKTEDLSIFSYYVESNSEAVLIDPTIDTDVYREFITKRKSTLKYVILSHYHADYLSGHTQFDVPLAMGPESKRELNTFQVKEFQDKDFIPVGDVKLVVMHSPGHTPESSCYLLLDKASKAECIFTGDTVFLGDVGRPDLAVKYNGSIEEEAGVLYDSMKKVKSLDGNIRIYPGHGSGSPCGKNIGTGNFCTVEGQQNNNYGFKFDNKEEFVKAVVADLSKPPQYFFHVAKLNQTGVGKLDEMFEKVNHPLSVEEFQELMGKMPVIQTRNEPETIIKGKVYWMVIRSDMSKWLTAALTPESEFIVFADPGRWRDIAERFFRVGYFNMKGYNNFSMADWKGETWKPSILNFQTFKEFKELKEEYRHLDVRNKPEHEKTGTADQAIAIPLPQLYSRVGQLKGEKHLIVNCRTGARARVGLSILTEQGIKASVLAQPFDQFETNGGIKVVPYKP